MYTMRNVLRSRQAPARPSSPSLYLSIQQWIGTWCKAGGKARRGNKLTTLPHNVVAEDGTSLTRCSLPLFQRIGHSFILLSP